MHLLVGLRSSLWQQLCFVVRACPCWYSMVLTTRDIGPVAIHPSSYQQSQQQLLDTIAGDKLVSLLRQIAQLSDYAAEIFNSQRTHIASLSTAAHQHWRSNT